MKATFDEKTNTVSIRQETVDAPYLAVEELKKERSKRQTLEKQMVAVLEKLGIEGV